MTNFFVPRARRRAGRVVDLKVPIPCGREQEYLENSKIFGRALIKEYDIPAVRIESHYSTSGRIKCYNYYLFYSYRSLSGHYFPQYGGMRGVVHASCNHGEREI